MRNRTLGLVLSLLTCLACGSSGGSTEDGSGSGDPRDPSTAPAGGPSASPAAPIATDLVGVWNVEGKDARGKYAGKAEVRADGVFVRTIAYEGTRVEDGRELHWAFVGKAKGDTRSSLSLDVVLDDRDFVVSRGGITRKVTDAPIAVAGKVTLEHGVVRATYAGTGVTGDETWTDRAPNGASPLVAVDRSIVDSHDPPSAGEKIALFQAYASFHALPAVQPFTSRPEFQAAVHGHVIDRTDFAFYRANKGALRVVNKSIDAISLGETLSRANAYRMTLAEKASGFDAETAGEFIHPQTGMLLDGAPAGQTKQVHFSAALWTGIYMASQVFRFEVTGDKTAEANVVKTLDGLLKLQEVTGDWSAFARAIRPATGDLTGGWHPGAGALSGLEWLEGGNNDMMKGLYISYVLGHRMLCGAPGHESLCARIRTNSRHLADDVTTDRGAGQLDSAWLAAVVSDDFVNKTSYQAKTQAAWAVAKIPLAQNTNLYALGTADWSGLNLGFVGGLFHMLLADKFDVGGDGKTTCRKIIEDTWKSVRRQRLPLWNLLDSAYAAGGPDAAALEDALWRLREVPFPKATLDIDRRVNPSFSLSPFPSLPWKNDWTTNPGRIQALRTAPLFEDPSDVFRFRAEMLYAGNVVNKPPAPDYLIAYWFARRYGLVTAAD